MESEQQNINMREEFGISFIFCKTMDKRWYFYMLNLVLGERQESWVIYSCVLCNVDIYYSSNKISIDFVCMDSVLISYLCGKFIVISYAATIEMEQSMWQVLVPHGFFLWSKFRFSRLLFTY